MRKQSQKTENIVNHASLNNDKQRHIQNNMHRHAKQMFKMQCKTCMPCMILCILHVSISSFFLVKSSISLVCFLFSFYGCLHKSMHPCCYVFNYCRDMFFITIISRDLALAHEQRIRQAHSLQTQENYSQVICAAEGTKQKN